jgi:hypothetical protein
VPVKILSKTSNQRPLPAGPPAAIVIQSQKRCLYGRSLHRCSLRENRITIDADQGSNGNYQSQSNSKFHKELLSQIAGEFLPISTNLFEHYIGSTLT